VVISGTGPTITAVTEEYDGNSWTNSNNLNTTRRMV
jgi:homoserine kinase